MRDGWVLYVDESGREDDPDDLHLVAGLLLHANDSVGLDCLLRAALEETWPLWPWPPHAADLNRPASRVAAAMKVPASAGESERATWLRARAEPLVRLVAHSSDVRARRFCDNVNAWTGGKLDFDVLREADHLMRDARPNAYRALTRECEAQERRLQQYLSALAGVQAARATVLLAVSPAGRPDLPADGLPTTKRGVRRDRYVRALEVLLAMTHQLLAGQRQEGRLYVATRHVHKEGPGDLARRVDLFPDIVDEIEASALAGCPKPPRPATLYPIGSPNRYDATVTPGVVLADWIANRARHALRRSSRPDALSALVSHGVLGTVEAPLPVVFAPLRGGGELPTVGVEGAPWLAVRDGLRGQRPALDALGAGWARDVTEPWLVAGKGWSR